jgi:hypothetical protein
MSGQNFQVSPVNLGSRAVVEPIVQPLYDKGTVATSGTTQIQYFKTPAGQGGKTLVQTNMDTAGQLSNPKLFVISGFRLHPDQNLAGALTNITDLKEVLHTGFFSFDIGGNFKNYLRIPLFAIPSGFGVTGYAVNDSTAAAFADIVNNGAPVISNFYSIAKYPIGIPPMQSFEATANWPTAPTITTALNMWCFLWGILGREVG